MLRLLLAVLLLSTPLSAQAQRGPTPVFAANVQQVEFVDEIEALGTLQANENVDLTATVTERITILHFTDNQRVKQGDMLAEMDASEEQAEYAEERSRFEEAERQVNRLRPLVKSGAATPAVLDEQEREFNIAQARLKAIQSRIDERRIVAPFDGVVGIRNISIGALVQPGTIITTIDDDRIMKLDFSVPEVFLSALKPGLEVEATSRAYPDQIFTAKIQSVNSRVDPITRAVLARAILDNEDQLLKAGMLIQVNLKKNPRDTLIVPEESIIARGEQNFVMLIDETNETARVNMQAVEIGSRRKGEVEILSGLGEGQKVVAHGTVRLRPGAEVTVKATEKNNESLTELLQQSKDGAE